MSITHLNNSEMLLRELMDLLDYVEESDSGNLFRPTFISSCRVMHVIKLENLIPRIHKELGKTPVETAEVKYSEKSYEFRKGARAMFDAFLADSYCLDPLMTKEKAVYLLQCVSDENYEDWVKVTEAFESGMARGIQKGKIQGLDHARRIMANNEVSLSSILKSVFSIFGFKSKT